MWTSDGDPIDIAELLDVSLLGGRLSTGVDASGVGSVGDVGIGNGGGYGIVSSSVPDSGTSASEFPYGSVIADEADGVLSKFGLVSRSRSTLGDSVTIRSPEFFEGQGRITFLNMSLNPSGTDGGMGIGSPASCWRRFAAETLLRKLKSTGWSGSSEAAEAELVEGVELSSRKSGRGSGIWIRRQYEAPGGA